MKLPLFLLVCAATAAVATAFQVQDFNPHKGERLTTTWEWVDSKGHVISDGAGAFVVGEEPEALFVDPHTSLPVEAMSNMRLFDTVGAGKVAYRFSIQTQHKGTYVFEPRLHLPGSRGASSWKMDWLCRVGDDTPTLFQVRQGRTIRFKIVSPPWDWDGMLHCEIRFNSIDYGDKLYWTLAPRLTALW